MIDDANPHDGRLWSGDYMPNLDELIISEGIAFHRLHTARSRCVAHGAPTCVTGQHAHNSGALSNNGQALDVSTTVATELDEAGYHTADVGKYLNGYRRFSPEKYDPPGWSEFDVIDRQPGQVRLVRRSVDREGRTTQHKTEVDDYSTDVIADIAVKRIREAPDDEPLFALIAPFTPHAPNLPAPRHEEDPRCVDVEPWAPPNYDEADVSDKPDYVQKQKPLGDDGFDLTAHCESLLAVDDLIGRVGKTLKREGRLEDTVFVFIADNGMSWGEHRRTGKVSPYATVMPAYASWPAGRGTQPRDEATMLSMIDFAPTFCELAGARWVPIRTARRPRTASPSPRCWPMSPCPPCATRCCTPCPLVGSGRCGGPSALPPIMPRAAGTTSSTATVSESCTTSAAGSATSGAPAPRATPARWTTCWPARPMPSWKPWPRRCRPSWPASRSLGRPAQAVTRRFGDHAGVEHDDTAGQTRPVDVDEPGLAHDLAMRSGPG